MNLSLGIVGLPNVGKSTLFNALTNNDVPAQNYPFCTIDPNVGIVPVMDPRLDKLAELVRPAKVTPAVVEFWDIAGLVKGAASGAGLGNKFLANIRNVSAIVHVVRAFENGNITHVENSVDPKRDIDLINSELILKDIETVSDKVKFMDGRARADRKLQPQLDFLLALEKHLNEGKLAKDIEVPNDEDIQELFNSLFLLTSKPVIYVVNTDASNAEANVSLVKQVINPGDMVVPMDIQLEFEISALPEPDKTQYLQELGMNEPTLAKLSRAAYDLLGLMSFFTAGEQEVRAWTITKGTKAPQAAGVIHTDFEKKFITADIVKCDDFLSAGGWVGAKEQGKVKLGGKDYVMEDGDVVLFRHNA
ncbi:MAG: redox-regulated ATPase YchF [Candidatus Doudnabacteria bacterium]|nr:redox-regulated ATPase YchF [Candidatus Doudnabacteria bacterium]